MIHNLDLVVEHVATEGSSKQIIFAKCNFEYEAESFTMEFTSDDIRLEPKSIHVSFRKQMMAQMNFAPRNNNYCSKMFGATIQFSKFPIDFFGFGTDRVFTILVVTKSIQKSARDVTTTFKIQLPVIKQSEIHFKPPGTRYPDEVARAVCRQGFKMNGENSRSELEMVIHLEEFRLLSKTKRFEVFGYVKMLEVFLDVENSFELDLVQKFNLMNQRITKVSATSIKIEVSTKATLLSYHQLKR